MCIRDRNSRNRVFVTDGEGIRTQAFDPSKLTDPSLIIYAPVRVLGNKTIVTNGDQTDTIYEGLDKQLTFEQSLRSREFEPDGPNYTPRISGVMHIENGNYSYAMSILKSDNGNPDSCLRYTYAYEKAVPGEGRFIHTYKCCLLYTSYQECTPAVYNQYFAAGGSQNTEFFYTENNASCPAVI